MPRGGKRAGAGSTPKKITIKAGLIVELVGSRMNEVTQDLISARDPRVRRWAWKQLLPYVYRRQPQAMELSGHLDAPSIIHDDIKNTAKAKVK